MAQANALKNHMASTGTDVATQAPTHKTLAHLLTDPKTKQQIALALPKHMTADRLARIALTEVRKNPKLAKCDQASFLGAIMQLASLGLEPGGALGHAYLIPFERSVKRGNVWTKIMEVQVVIGYRGMIDIARRSGQIISISARVVRARDKFSYTYGLDETLQHEPYEGPDDPGEVTHAYAVAKLVGGGVQFEVMPVAQILRVRDASQGYKAAVASAAQYNKPVDSPWTNHFDEMARKTPTRNLFKWLPVSIEMQRAVGLDEQADAGLPQHNATVIDGDYTVQETGGDSSRGTDAGTDGPGITSQEVHDALLAAKDQDNLDAAGDLIRMLPEGERAPLTELWQKRSDELAA